MKLPTHAYSAMIARWAWHSFRVLHAPVDPVDPDGDLIERDLDDQEWNQSVQAVEKAILQASRKIILRPPVVAMSVEQHLQEMAHTIPPGNSRAATESRRTVVEHYTELCSALVALPSGLLETLTFLVLDSAEVAYSRAGVKPPRATGNRLALSIEMSLPNPGKGVLRDIFAADAKVMPGCHLNEGCRDCDHDQSLVLTVAPAYFDQETLGGLPFVLFHEIVCHVMQGPQGISRPVPDRYSEFAEGFMDFAAWHVFQDAVRNSNPTSGKACFIQPPDDPQFFLDHGYRIYSLRHVRPVPITPDSKHDLNHESGKARLYSGWDAARVFMDEAKRLGHEDPSHKLLEFAFRLNVDPTCSPDERDLIVTRLVHHLRRPKGFMKSQTLAVRSSFTQALRNGTYDELVNLLLRTKTTRSYRD